MPDLWEVGGSLPQSRIKLCAAEIAKRTSDDRVRVISVLRRLRMTGPEIAEVLDLPLLTVSGILSPQSGGVLSDR